MRILLVFLGLLGASLAQWDTHYVGGRAGMVHLFEWEWGTIADECETFLGPNGFAGVQVSPPSENRLVNGEWWERYQPVSYNLETRSGNRAAFADMVERCNNVGVRIYPDIVINHMCGADGGVGTGSGGSSYNAISEDFPSVPYSASDFNDDKCPTSSGNIENYQDVNQVRDCRLLSLLDLNQESDYVRGKIIGFMNDLLSLGVAGFRVDACKHMWPSDLDAIFGSVNDVNWGGRPMIFQEVIDQGGEPITASQYFNLGRVTEFKYGININNNKYSIQSLGDFGESWGMMPDGNALVFLNNHDNQRGHGGGGGVITFEDPYNLKIFTAFMMAWPYGVPRIMSSYYFSDSDQGPPSEQRSVLDDGSCGNGWVCEHRWRQIKNMAAFAAAAEGEPMSNWWSSYQQIAFSRGNKAFIAINTASNTMSGSFQTGMPHGDYCNVYAADLDACGGHCVSVDGAGYANIAINPSADPAVAIHVNAPCNCPPEGCSTAPPPSGGTCTECSSCTEKVDCGYMGIVQDECEASGCLWCPDNSGSNAPWCVYRTSESGEPDGSPDCNVDDSSKQDCGQLGTTQYECESDGCCWKESNTNGVPWCYYRA